MSINIFQFLKQGTTLSHKSLQTNKLLQQKITPKQKIPNQHYFQTGKFHQSDNQDDININGNQKQQLNQEKMKHQYNKNIQKSIDLRKKYHVKVQGTDVPFVSKYFGVLAKKYHIDGRLLEGLAEMGFKKPTPVQMQTIPALLQDRNLLVTAPTGTGKTISYLLPIVQNILKSRRQLKQNTSTVQKTNKKQKPGKEQKKQKVILYNTVQAIIIAPQQQLSTQIAHQLQNLTKRLRQNLSNESQVINYKCITTLTEQQLQLINKNKNFGTNVLISTPQAFLNLFGNDLQKSQIFSHVRYIVLDECDKYFQQSFLQQIRSILQFFTTIKHKPIYGLFSATIQYPVQELLKGQLLDDALRIQVGGKNKVLTSIQQSIQYCTNQYGKILQLKNMIAQNRFVPPALIFVQEKIRAKQLFYQLKKIMKNGPGGLDLSKKIEVISGEKSKQERQQILEKFEKGIFLVLITTDIIARGIDFSHVNLVINYDFPNSMLSYIHRVGRTGRAQRTGKAVTFFTDEDKPIVKNLANLLNASGCKVPQWILQLPKVDRKLKKKLQKYPTKRLPVGVSEGKDKNFQKQLEKMQKIWKRKKERVQQKQKKQKAENGQQLQSQWIQA